MTANLRIGFVGIGIMGAPMVRRLMAKGWQLAVWNLEPERYAEVPGATVMDSPAAVRAASDIVIFCVLHGDAVEECCFGPHGLARAQGGASLLIDTSTINPDRTLMLAERLARETGMGWVDAPISGGPAAAADGQLTIMMGGSQSDVATARPVLADLSANLTHIGGLGAGQTTKIINQAIVGVGYVLMAEVLALAEASGIDASRLPAALAGGMADSTVLKRIYPQQQARDYDPPRGYARQLDKDLKNVMAFVGGLGLDLPLVARAAARYHDFAGTNEMADSAAVARLYECPRS
ncbi:MAG: 2-hydroxy-3-oxopropionate reductase [Alphaproteobacteria bacterium 64-11]|nr:NAD(P)-dependent oxidoreductase [Alphaproteobacteria bacterium]OJU13731.1 MAG: 2-hydroxy-3-oxopropionate reductase [Alphaproteobacteria bacterium 64-11]